MLEIKQLENKAQKLLTRLGNETYKSFAEKGETQVNSSDAEIQAIMTEIASVKESIEKHEADLAAKK
jgi:multidrug resistance efflux pump